jgi:hypothetical protein
MEEHSAKTPHKLLNANRIKINSSMYFSDPRYKALYNAVSTSTNPNLRKQLLDYENFHPYRHCHTLMNNIKCISIGFGVCTAIAAFYIVSQYLDCTENQEEFL